MFDFARIDVADDTIHMLNPVTVVDMYVIVHLYHPSRHGVIVDVTAADRLRTAPVRRSKFAKVILSPAKQSCANLLVPCGRKTLAVLVGELPPIFRRSSLVLGVPSQQRKVRGG